MHHTFDIFKIYIRCTGIWQARQYLPKQSSAKLQGPFYPSGENILYYSTYYLISIWGRFVLLIVSIPVQIRSLSLCASEAWSGGTSQVSLRPFFIQKKLKTHTHTHTHIHTHALVSRLSLPLSLSLFLFLSLSRQSRQSWPLGHCKLWVPWVPKLS